ncbi:Actin-like 6A [Tyrophagus putrescentiae]|nr:Actin-like 6A [Tyrophagus putrescentiae]
MTNVYGGDEVGAVVMDIGSHSIKVGYAGEDSPRSEISNIIAVHDKEVGDGGSSTIKERRYYIDPTEVMVPRGGQEAKTFFNQGVIEDFDLLDRMMQYIYARHVISKSEDHPLLVSEVVWNTKASRERFAELMFERYHVPALYVAPAPMLVAFSTGRPTALVFDSGAYHTTAVPVVDGHVLAKCMVKTRYAGDYVTGLAYRSLVERGVEVNPYYLVKSKEAVPPGAPPNFVRRQLPPGFSSTGAPLGAGTWHNYMTRMEVANYKHSVLRVAAEEYDREEVTAELAKAKGGRDQAVTTAQYHFPDGFNLELSVDEQYQLLEPFFNKEMKPKVAGTAVEAEASQGGSGSHAPASLMDTLKNPALTYQEIVLQSVAKADIDVRPALLNSIVLAGGNTLFPGFTDRLTNELAAEAPQNYKFKVVANNTPTERKYGAWIGGSILASLGTFQQLWVSKTEYEEFGKSCIDPDNRLNH